MKKMIYLLIILVLSGCCTAEKYQKILNNRVGIEEKTLIRTIGNPSSVYDTDGERSLEYKFSNFHCNEFGCYTNWCTTQYIIKDGLVDHWTYNGNQCCSTK